MSAEASFGSWEQAVDWLLAQPEHRELCRACYYDRPSLAAAQRFWADPEWQALRSLMPAARGTALDVGAGMGIAAYALARDGWRTTALEPDASSLVGAGAIRRLADEAGLAIEVVQEWGESLPFADASFDLVHARQVLHHARELPRFCRELQRVLKPGGLLLATREHVISSPEQLPAFLANHPLHRLYGGENAFTLDTYLGAMRDAGLVVQQRFGPLESVINYAPFTEAGLVDEIARRAARLPGGDALARLLLAPPWRRGMLGLLSRLDRRPGRLHTFVARRPEAPGERRLRLGDRARGFIGRHVARAAAARGHTVVGLGHGAWTEAEHRAWGLAEWRNGELSHDNLDALAASHGLPQQVVHLAGGSAVGPSFVQPAEDFRRSVSASAALAEWLRLHAPAARVVMASSAAVYGAGQVGPIAETAACAPFSPYGFHKRMAELVFESHARNFGLQAALVRLFSVYGPGLRKQLLWDVSTRLAQRPDHLLLGGTGAERRDWLHVEDAASLLLAAVQAAAADCPVFNGGTSVGLRIAEVAAALTAAWGQPGLPVQFSGQGRAGDPAALVAAPSAAQRLGWQPQRRWADGVAEYVAWYRQATREQA